MIGIRFSASADLADVSAFAPSTAAAGAQDISASADLVDVSAFAPSTAAAGETILVQVFLHQVDQAKIAQTLAAEADSDTKRRGIATLATEITRGQRVDVILEAPGLVVKEPAQYLIWRGDPRACQFFVDIPSTATLEVYRFHVRIQLEAIRVGTLCFTIKQQRATDPQTMPPSEGLGFFGVPAGHDKAINILGDWSKRYKYAFLSYAHEDRAEVLKRAQALKAARIDFFHDLLSLDPGERWRLRLFEEIKRCDLFLLFWSSHAAQSEWVTREAEHALECQKRSPNQEPDITPIPLEGPPIPPPPDKLKEIHFNDALRYVIAAVEAEVRRGP